MMKLSHSDIELASELLTKEGPSAMYDKLAEKGDKYAVLANGVARGNSIAGVAAINYMKGVAAEAGMPMRDEDVEAIRFNMAKEYLNALKAHAVDGFVSGPIPQAAIANFHKQVFEGSGYPESAWTLYPIFLGLPEESKQIYWGLVLSSAGDPAKELELAGRTHAFMSQKSVLGSKEVIGAARKWFHHIEAPTGWFDLASTTFDKLVDFFIHQDTGLGGGEVGVVEGAVGECDTVGQATIDVAVGDVIADIVLALEVAAGFGCGGDFDFD